MLMLQLCPASMVEDMMDPPTCRPFRATCPAYKLLPFLPMPMALQAEAARSVCIADLRVLAGPLTLEAAALAWHRGLVCVDMTFSEA